MTEEIIDDGRIACEKLLDKGLRGFVLFSLFKQGRLHPYHPDNGMQIIDLDTVEWRPKQSFEEVLADEYRVNNLRNNHYDEPWPKEKVEAHAKSIYEKLSKDSVIPDGCIGESFTLSVDERAAQQRVQQARKWLVKRQEAITIEEFRNFFEVSDTESAPLSLPIIAKDDPYYSEELEMAISAWTALYQNGVISTKKGHKGQIKEWLEEHYPEASQEAKNRIATVVLPISQKKGGAPSID